MATQAPTLAVDDIAAPADAYPLHLHRAPEELIRARHELRMAQHRIDRLASDNARLLASVNHWRTLACKLLTERHEDASTGGR